MGITQDFVKGDGISYREDSLSQVIMSENGAFEKLL